MNFYLSILYFIIPFLTYALSKKISFFDKPQGELKIHKKSIPYSGGILSIVASLIFFVCFGFYLPVLIILLVAVIGIIDDYYDLGILFRLFTEFVLVSVLVNYFITYDNFLIFASLVFIGVVFINAINFIDIKDGLATSFAITSISALINFRFQVDTNLLLFSTLFSFSLISFYCLNSEPAKTYQGDGGAYALAIILYSFALSFFNYSSDSFNEIINVGVWTEIPLFSPLLISLSYLVIYFPVVFEFIFVVLVRVKKGLNPLKGSNDHIAIRLINHNKSTFYTSALFSIPAIFSVIYSSIYFGSINVFSLINLSLLTIILSIKYLTS